MSLAKHFRAACVVLCLAGWIGAASAAGFLHTHGQDMVDAGGHKVLLRGLGLGNWFLPEGYMWKFGKLGDRPRRIEGIVRDLIGKKAADRFWREYRENYVTEADIRRLAGLGFNCVRPALDARRFLTEGKHAVYVEEGFNLLDNLVRWCRKYHVYVIIDMHAAPGGQTGANIDDSIDDQPALFMDPSNQDRLVRLWVKIAKRYRNEPYVAAYDLLNEPLPRRTGAEAKYGKRLEPLYRRITRAIRQVDRNHMITVEGADWANDWSVFSKPFDSNMFYQFHYYCWDRPDHVNGIERYLKRRTEWNTPIWAGETGEKDNAIYWATTGLFESHNIGWSFWPWKKMDARNAPYSVNPPEGWDKISAYSRGGDKPSRALAQKAFDQLLQNIKLKNCIYYPDVVNAIFRRIPGKVEAENYGHEGLDHSYHVKTPDRMSRYYRTSEPVPIEVIGNGRRGYNSRQYIKLTSGEWTAYGIHSRKPHDYQMSIRVKSNGGPAILRVTVGHHSQEVTVSQSKWGDIRLEPMKFSVGDNRLKLSVLTGTAGVDWLDFQ